MNCLSFYCFLLLVSFCFCQPKRRPEPDFDDKRPGPSQLTYRILDAYQPDYLDFIIQEYHRRGFERVSEYSQNWNATWCIYYPPKPFLQLKPWQRVNNMPAIRFLVSKDNLHRVLSENKVIFGQEDFSFWPVGYNLEDPKQYNQLKSIYIDAHENNRPAPIYIIKRPALARGLGVHLVASLDQVEKLSDPSSPCFPLNRTRPLAQEYITNVLTLEQHKVTLRVYATLTSLYPFRLYVFRDGLVRICSRKYSLAEEFLSDTFTHIDSINLNEDNEQEWLRELKESNSTLQHEGLRCSISYLLTKLESEGVNSTKLWEDICRIILLSFMAGEDKMFKEWSEMSMTNRTIRVVPFEMVGFDILIDSNYKPYVLEINNTPSVAPHTNLENKIKKAMLSDLFTLVDMENKDLMEIPKLVEEKWRIIQSLPKDHTFISSLSSKRFRASSVKDREDLWALVETELENRRRGQWLRLFPKPTAQRYLKYVVHPSNKLIMEYLEAGMTIDDIHL